MKRKEIVYVSWICLPKKNEHKLFTKERKRESGRVEWGRKVWESWKGKRKNIIIKEKENFGVLFMIEGTKKEIEKRAQNTKTNWKLFFHNFLDIFP